MIAGVTLILTISACGSGEKLMTDTGSASRQEISKEEYLNPDAINQTGSTDANSNYTVYTLEKGLFEEGALKQTLDRAYINVPTVELTIEEGTVLFDEYVCGMFDYVESGETIATVRTEVDEISIEEAELTLKRLQERYMRDEAKLAEDLEDLRVERTMIYNDYERFVVDVQCEQLKLDWEKAKRNYEQQIKDAAERLSNLNTSSNLTDIVTDESGYVIYNTRYSAGIELGNGEYICHILTSDDYYVQTSNQADNFTYGMTMKFRTMEKEVQGKVISGGSTALYGNLDTGKATFAVDFGGDVPANSRMQNSSLVMEGNLKTVNNVITIPKQAVREDENNYYVTVLKEDGSLITTEFIPGGENTECFWVYEGLEEGMQIIY